MSFFEFGADDGEKGVLAVGIPTEEGEFENCPRCGDEVVAESEYAGAIDAQCESCDYQIHVDDDPRVPSIRHLLSAIITPYTHPYTFELGFAGTLVSVSLMAWAFYNPFNEWYFIAPLLLSFGMTFLSDPPHFCAECQLPVDDIDHFCWNCGSDGDHTSYVDLDAEPFWRGWADQTLPGWFNVDGVDVDIRYEDANAVVDAVIGRFAEQWRRILDLGTICFAGIYVYLLYQWWNIAGILFAHDMVWDLQFSLGAPSNTNASGPILGITLADLFAFGEWIVMYAIPAIIILEITVLIHELGHGIALRLHGHDVDAFGAKFAFGVVPTIGYTEPDVDLDGNTSLRAAWHLDTGGITLNLLSILPILFIARGDWMAPLSWGTGLTGFYFYVFYLMSLLAVLNAFPWGGMDGDHFQIHGVEALARHLGSGENSLLPFAAGGLVTLGIAVTAILLVL